MSTNTEEVNMKIKQYTETSAQTDENSISCRHFKGFESLNTDEKMSQLGGVSLTTFQFLLVRTEKVNQSPISSENRLIIFLMKMKLGLTFSAIGLIFSIHRVSVSRIFKKLLINLYNSTRDCIFWPTKMQVQYTMPECFKPDFEDVRIILDCTEFRIDIPKRIDHRLFCYSTYKGGYTFKVLIGITPSGFICLVSKVCGGRKSDSNYS